MFDRRPWVPQRECGRSRDYCTHPVSAQHCATALVYTQCVSILVDICNTRHSMSSRALRLRASHYQLRVFLLSVFSFAFQSATFFPSRISKGLYIRLPECIHWNTPSKLLPLYQSRNAFDRLTRGYIANKLGAIQKVWGSSRTDTLPPMGKKN